MSELIRFRLKSDKKEGTWSIKKGRSKKDGVYKFISYWPGSDSIFDEDNKNSTVLPRSVVFKYNDIITDPAIEIIVDPANKALYDFLTSYEGFGTEYDIYSEKKASKERNLGYDNISKALSYVRGSDDLDTQALALAILGGDTIHQELETSKAQLNRLAIENPLQIIAKYENDDHKTRHLAAVAMVKGVIKTNPHHTAIVWGDNDGVILHLATGEEAIGKMSEILSDSTEKSRSLLQQLAARVEKAGVKIAEEVNKDDEIADLKRQLAEMRENKEFVVADPNYEGMELEDLQKAYEAKFNKKLSFKYQNDQNWIIEKLRE